MKQDTAVLTNAMLIPDEWLPDVPAALQFIKDHPRLADDPFGQTNIDLNKLLDEKNLCVQAAAFRCIAYRDRGDPRLLDALRSAKSTQLSIFTYQILTDGPSNANDIQKAERQLEAILTDNHEQLDAIAFGACAAVANNVADHPLQDAAGRIIHDIKAREDAHPPKTPDLYLANILKLLEGYQKSPDNRTAPTTAPAKSAS